MPQIQRRSLAPEGCFWEHRQCSGLSAACLAPVKLCFSQIYDSNHYSLCALIPHFRHNRVMAENNPNRTAPGIQARSNSKSTLSLYLRQNTGISATLADSKSLTGWEVPPTPPLRFVCSSPQCGRFRLLRSSSFRRTASRRTALPQTESAPSGRDGTGGPGPSSAAAEGPGIVQTWVHLH